MADDDDPTSYNYELRVMGLRGDDEDDLGADAKKLLGSNAAINLDADAPAHPQGQASQLVGSKSVSNSIKKRRASTYKIWNDFDEIYEVIGGKEVRSKHCNKDFSGKSIGGTNHLGRHILICPVLKRRFALAPSCTGGMSISHHILFFLS